jgi:high-affinity iron transporter
MMLINTVFLLLRDGLPVFFLGSLSLALLPGQRQLKITLLALLGGTFVSALLQLNATAIIDSWQGSGLERILFSASTFALLSFTALIAIASRCQHQALGYLLGLSLSLQWLISSTKMLTFYRAFWLQEQAASALWLGSIIGIGLCMSLAIVLYFALQGIARYTRIVTLVLLALFFSGHFAKGVSLLEQMGVLNSQQLWSTEKWLAENTEWAHILSALTGYEATPSYWQFAAFVSAFSLLLGAILSYRRQLNSHLQATEVTP